MARKSIAAMLLVCWVAGVACGQSKVYEPHNTTAILQITFSQDEGLMSSGSCVAVDPYHVLTAPHVVGSSTATIKAKGGDVKAKVVAIDFYHDRALLRAVDKLTEKARKLREDAPKEGEQLWAIGFGGRGFGYTRCSAAGGKIQRPEYSGRFWRACMR
jgi:S1-C subfamily serine protease